MPFRELKRRQFITLLGGAAATWPVAARAQQRALPVAGFLSSTPPEGFEARVAALHQGLAEAGYVEGSNVAMELRWANTRYDLLPMLAAELVQRRVAVMVVYGAVNAVLAAKAATATIQIVFLVGSDPVAFGLVASLNRPGGNVTGVTLLVRELTAKRLEILHEMIPGTPNIGFLINPNNSNAESETRELQDTARTIGLQIRVFKVNDDREIDAAFTSFREQGVGAFLVGTDALFTSQFRQIAALAKRHTLPGIVNTRDYVDAGGLMSYGSNQVDAFRLVGAYAGRVLKGEKPADLPVLQPTRFELIINRNAAKALGVTIPPMLLIAADEVIE